MHDDYFGAGPVEHISDWREEYARFIPPNPPSQNNTGYVWKTEDAEYFLRDDTALGIYAFDAQQTYSVFRRYPDYCRIGVITFMTIVVNKEQWDIAPVLEAAEQFISIDLMARTGKRYDVSTLFIDQEA